MVQNIYLLRDKVALRYFRCIDSENDATAVRFVVENLGQSPRYKDLELLRSGAAFDVELGDIVQVERAVVALPPQPVVPSVDEQAQGK